MRRERRRASMFFFRLSFFLLLSHIFFSTFFSPFPPFFRHHHQQKQHAQDPEPEEDLRPHPPTVRHDGQERARRGGPGSSFGFRLFDFFRRRERAPTFFFFPRSRALLPLSRPLQTSLRCAQRPRYFLEQLLTAFGDRKRRGKVVRRRVGSA